MRIAVKSTLILLMLYLAIMAALAFWVERDLRHTAGRIMLDTARLLGKELEGALHEPIMDALRQRNSKAPLALRETVETMGERSDIVTSINVVDAEGKVIASDDETVIGKRFPVPIEVFAGEREIKLASSFDRPFSPGRHIPRIPLSEDGELLGYLQLTLSNQPIAELYDQAYSLLMLTALAGTIAVVGLGLILQWELNRLSKSLSSLLMSALERPLGTADARPDEFVAVRNSASQLGRKLHEARGDAERAWRELDSVAKLLNVGVVILERDGRPEFVSDAIKQLLTGGQDEAFDARFQELRQALGSAMEQLRRQEGTVSSLDLDLVNGGVRRQLRCELHVLDRREWKGCMVMIRDRSMIEALNEDLRAATRFRGLARLYIGAAHDLKAPLNAMLMNLEMLKRTFQSDAHGNVEIRGRQERYAGVLTEELARLNRFLDALLEQTAPSGDGREAVDLVDMVEGLKALFTAQARQQRICLEFDVPAFAVTVFGSPGKLRQSLINVLVNALEAMPQGGDLRLQLFATNTEVQIDICDTGPGIPSGLLDKVFEMHFTTKDSGTGIGLYVTRVMLEQQGGGIQVASRLGEGTCFHIRLPISSAVEDIAAEDPPLLEGTG